MPMIRLSDWSLPDWPLAFRRLPVTRLRWSRSFATTAPKFTGGKKQQDCGLVSRCSSRSPPRRSRGGEHFFVKRSEKRAAVAESMTYKPLDAKTAETVRKPILKPDHRLPYCSIKPSQKDTT